MLLEQEATQDGAPLVRTSCLLTVSYFLLGRTVSLCSSSTPRDIKNTEPGKINPNSGYLFLIQQRAWLLLRKDQRGPFSAKIKPASHPTTPPSSHASIVWEGKKAYKDQDGRPEHKIPPPRNTCSALTRVQCPASLVARALGPWRWERPLCWSEYMMGAKMGQCPGSEGDTTIYLCIPFALC